MYIMYSIMLIGLALAHYATCHDTSQCPSIDNLKFTIRTSRNRTGHWSSQVDMESDETSRGTNAEGALGSQRWTVDLDQSHIDADGTETFTAILQVPPARKDSDYELCKGLGYYKFHTDPKRWLEAVKVCEQEGAHLAIINSEKEAEFLKDLFARYPKLYNVDHGDVAGIGFHDRYVEGQYLTVYDEPLASTGYVRWSAINNQPDNYHASETNPGEDCGSIHRDGGLNDIGCNVRMAYICEKEL